MLSALLKSPSILATALKVLLTGAGGGGMSSSLLHNLHQVFCPKKKNQKKLGFISSMPDRVEGRLWWVERLMHIPFINM